MQVLESEKATVLFGEMKPLAVRALVYVNEQQFVDAQSTADEIRNLLASVRDSSDDFGDDVLNDLYVLDRYADLLFSYAELWSQILSHRFSASWSSLQDALDILRIVKRFSCMNVEFFETQLLELEKAYPYKIFFSVGMYVERFDCSLCEQDIDSDQCPHRCGELYGGRMARGVARNITGVNHVGMVRDPEDKRCVVVYKDESEEFKVVRFLSTLIARKQLRISEFCELRRSKRLKRNPAYRKVGRNAPCFCGSGTKFKKCCISKEYLQGEHLEIVPYPRNIEEAVA